jgi:hypothetical protein
MGRKSGRTMYVDKEVEFDFSDVMEYIEYYATESELDEILEEVGSSPSIELKANGSDGSYVRGEKEILLSLAANKYTLEELEQKLGTKFDLI